MFTIFLQIFIFLEKTDTYVSMPTGSGKSLCYHLPGAMQENQITIVFEPLISLMKNQLDYLNQLRIPAETINSSTSSSDRSRILGDLKAKKTHTKFLYITPEQAATTFFLELMETLVKYKKVAYVAVDEAHCVRYVSLVTVRFLNLNQSHLLVNGDTTFVKITSSLDDCVNNTLKYLGLL